MTHPLPCPFCGHVGVSAVETSTFRWVAAECGKCGARGPESRRDTLTPGAITPESDMRLALLEWNRRKT